MITNSKIKSLVKQLDLHQLQTILREYYSSAENKPASIYNAIQRPYDVLAYTVIDLVISGEIKPITLIRKYCG